MQIWNEDGQGSLFARDGCAGRTCLAPSAQGPPRGRTSASSSRRSSELRTIPFMSLDLTPGHGNLLGESYWELISPSPGGSSTLNTGPAPLSEEDVYSLSQILQDAPPRKYYLSKTACLGILRRARERGKELPPQLKTALMAQAGLTPLAAPAADTVAFAANQRDEVRDLHNVAGALSAQHRGAPMRAQRSGSHGERSRSGMSELSPSGGSEGYGACGDEKQQTFIAQDCLTPWDTQQSRIFTPESRAPTLASADGGGGRNPGGLLFAAGFCAGAGPSAGSIGYQEEVAPTLKASASGNMMPSILCLTDHGGQRMDLTADMTPTLRAQMGTHLPLICLNDQGGGVMSCSKNVSGTLRAQEHGHQPLVMGVQLFENHGIDARYTGPHRVSPTLTNRNGSGGNNLPLALQVQESICISGNAIDRQPHNGGNGLGCQEGIAYTLTATDHHAVFSRQRVDVFKHNHVASTESARQHKDATDLVLQKTETESPLLIRRLTPLECERLQGFPDFWTDLPGASDSARYRALGNSVAIPCVEYIMRGIAMAA